MAGRYLLAGALTLAGCCAQPKPIEVKIPVPVRAPAPPELLQCRTGLPVPVFMSCNGLSCLTTDQEKALVGMLDQLDRCEAGWRAWGTSATPD